MPVFDYRCTQCRREYEYFHNGTADKIPKCPHCGSQHAKKLVSKGISHILKGKGWAKDGYG